MITFSPSPSLCCFNRGLFFLFLSVYPGVGYSGFSLRNARCGHFSWFQFFFDWLVRRVKIWLVGLAGLLVGSI